MAENASPATNLMARPFNGNEEGRHHQRKPTIPFARSTRQKPRRFGYLNCVLCAFADAARRWPLALRFIKGAIHRAIILQVTLHGLFAALIVFLDQHLDGTLGLPSSIVRQDKEMILLQVADVHVPRYPASPSWSVSCLYQLLLQILTNLEAEFH